jgi:hypothetical protein
MGAAPFIVDILERSVGIVKQHLADFSEAEMFVRPCPGANHAAWQLGQVISAEPRLIEVVAQGVHPALPEGFAQRFTKETAGIDDPSKFPTKAELLEQFERIRGATIQWVKGLSDEQLAQPTPEKWHGFANTAGDMALMQAMHSVMHLGQIQVIRRKLGKPVLF